MGYTDATTIRTMTGLTSSDVATSTINDLITIATGQLNRDINFKVNQEKVSYIDDVRENDIDGSNTDFYIRHCKREGEEGYFLGDYDNDGDVDTADVEIWEKDTGPSPSTIATVAITSIDHSLGKITVTTAPSANKKVYISYSAAPVDEATPDQLVKNACTQLTSALCFLRLDANQLKMGRFRLGKLAIMAPVQGYRYWYDIYKDTVNQINARVADKLDLDG